MMSNSFAALLERPDEVGPLPGAYKGDQTRRQGNGQRPANEGRKTQTRGKTKRVVSGDIGFRSNAGPRTKQGTVVKPGGFRTLPEKRDASGPKKRVTNQIRSLPKWIEPSSSLVIWEPSAVGAAVDELLQNTRIAVDCEGVCLSRTGMLTLVQVASNDSVYIFDIAKGGRAVFDVGLRHLLECPTTLKVLHDCRHDCDALQHQFDVRVAPVLDTQVGFAVLRSVRNLPVGLPVSLKTLLRKFCGVSEDSIAVKDSIKAAMRERDTFWLDRPLTPAALAYARFDVIYLIHVAKVMAIHISNANSHGWERVLKESAKYSALFREDADGPRKESARWARLVTEAQCEQAVRSRQKALTTLMSSDPMHTFSFDRERVLQLLVAA
jgi:3'-5' exonuclease